MLMCYEEKTANCGGGVMTRKERDKMDCILDWLSDRAEGSLEQGGKESNSNDQAISEAQCDVFLEVYMRLSGDF